MKLSKLVWTLAGMIAYFSVQAQSTQPMEILYIGSYSNRGAGIYVYAFDRERLTAKEIQVVPNLNSPSFLAIHPNKKFLYSANEGNNTVSAYRIDAQTGKLSPMNEASSEGRGPCHVSIDLNGQFLFVSNYGSGSLAVYHLLPDGQIGGLADSIQNSGTEGQKPHMHAMIPSADGQYVYASDLGLDQIYTYKLENATGKLHLGANAIATVTKGDGPRHLALHPNGRFAYSAGELHSVVNAFKIDEKDGHLSPIQRIDMLPSGYTDTSYAADIHLSADGRFLYASNRGHDSIIIYEVDPSDGRLTRSNHVATEGKHPRNFLIDSKGQFAIVANRDDDNLVFFKRNAKDGSLNYADYQLHIPAAVFVTLLLIE